MDAVIGVGTWASIVRSGINRLSDIKGNLIAQNSLLRCIISGSYEAILSHNYFSYHVNVVTNQ